MSRQSRRTEAARERWERQEKARQERRKANLVQIPDKADWQERQAFITQTRLDRTRLIIGWELWIVAIRYFDTPHESTAYRQAWSQRFNETYGWSANPFTVLYTEGPDTALRMQPFGTHWTSASFRPFTMSLLALRLSPYGDFDWPFSGSDLTLGEHLLNAYARKQGVAPTVIRTRALTLE